MFFPKFIPSRPARHYNELDIAGVWATSLGKIFAPTCDSIRGRITSLETHPPATWPGDTLARFNALKAKFEAFEAVTTSAKALDVPVFETMRSLDQIITEMDSLILGLTKDDR